MQWWNNATIRAFRDRTQCIIDQYSRYKIDEVGLYVNGRMTQGENIADNGGLKQSFRVSCSNSSNLSIENNNFRLTKNGFHNSVKRITYQD